MMGQEKLREGSDEELVARVIHTQTRFCYFLRVMVRLVEIDGGRKLRLAVTQLKELALLRLICGVSSNQISTMASRSADITRQTAGSLCPPLVALEAHSLVRDQHQLAHRCGRPGHSRRRYGHWIFGPHDMPAMQILPNVRSKSLLRMNCICLILPLPGT